jgi:E3 ubiquitin-protein ligase FANCL
MVIKSENMSIISIFPLLLPQKSNFYGYQGFINIQGNEYIFRIELNSSNINSSLKENISIFCSPFLKELLKEQECIIQQRLHQCTNLESFLVEFKEILERVIKKKKQNFILPTISYYSKLLEEIHKIGWDKLINIDETLTKIEIKLKDNCNRNHLIQFQFPSDYPLNPPYCTSDLPKNIEINWYPKKSTLGDIIKQYEKAFEIYQEFWEVVEDIDTNTWILEPEHPSYSSTTRRIALGNHCSLQIHIDPNNSKNIPECYFLGSDSIISQLRDNFNKNLFFWNNQKTLRENLENILEIKFPSPKTSKKTDFNEECGICYSYRFENLIPDKVCDNNKCGKLFHKKCLFEWLRSIPSSRQSFDTIFGECPYCNNSITVKIN